jgi:hypothetical protein
VRLVDGKPAALPLSRQSRHGLSQTQGLVLIEAEALGDNGCPRVRTGARLMEIPFMPTHLGNTPNAHPNKCSMPYLVRRIACVQSQDRIMFVRMAGYKPGTTMTNDFSRLAGGFQLLQ